MDLVVILVIYLSFCTSGLDYFFFFHNPNGPNVSFIIGIQTNWMLHNMVKYAHNSIIAMNLTFNIKQVQGEYSFRHFPHTYNCFDFNFLYLVVFNIDVNEVSIVYPTHV